ncbi:aldo/keto reductase [Carboxydocella sp. ULO1]|uniref:aldo/keto reductase n=1 Tax=Carboxydocella sp. ULO1 TaxID=1926599 RepID=UPI0009AE23F6|nr:aldo/keto reductase [Carboxydocella sp. ULO1]GAW29036.1 aldo/keto reductase [Carboxydocella sp. ULO1]
MEYRQLSGTDIVVSRLGLGGIPLQKAEPEQVANLVAAAADYGINFIDTARGYGASETLLGQALKGYRSRFLLASKSMARERETMLKDIETSLRLLQTDYLDFYQLHNLRTPADWQRVTAPGGALEALFLARERGWVRWVGVTSHSAEIMAQAIKSSLFASMMFPYNVVEQQNRGLFQSAREHGLLTLAMKPLAGGFIPAADQALRWLAADPAVDCLLVGMASAAEVTANVQALAQGALGIEEEEKLLTWAQAAGQEFCRRCGYCLPCPQQIDIPMVFLLEGYYDRYDLKEWAQERYAALPVPASQCQACGQCQEKCPYQLPIPAKLARAAGKLASS